jgi:hypothetical protein
MDERWHFLCKRLGATVMIAIEAAPEVVLKELQFYLWSIIPVPESNRNMEFFLEKASPVLEELSKDPGRFCFFHANSGNMRSGQFLLEAVKILSNRYGEDAPDKIKTFLSRAKEVLEGFEQYL